MNKSKIIYVHEKLDIDKKYELVEENEQVSIVRDKDGFVFQIQNEYLIREDLLKIIKDMFNPESSDQPN